MGKVFLKRPRKKKKSAPFVTKKATSKRNADLFRGLSESIMKLRPPVREVPETHRPLPTTEAVIGDVAAGGIATEEGAEEARIERSIR